MSMHHVCYVATSTFAKADPPKYLAENLDDRVEGVRKYGRRMAWNNGPHGWCNLYVDVSTNEGGGWLLYEDNEDLHMEWHRYGQSLWGEARRLLRELEEVADESPWFTHVVGGFPGEAD